MVAHSKYNCSGGVHIQTQTHLLYVPSLCMYTFFAFLRHGMVWWVFVLSLFVTNRKEKFFFSKQTKHEIIFHMQKCLINFNYFINVKIVFSLCSLRSHGQCYCFCAVILFGSVAVREVSLLNSYTLMMLSDKPDKV